MDNLKGIIALIFSITLFTYSFAFDEAQQAYDAPLPQNAACDGVIAENTLESSNLDPEYISSDGISSINDPYYSQQWSLVDNDLPRKYGDDRYNPVIVAVLDTGIDKDHEDLSGRILQEIDLNGGNSPDDAKGHGTHIAGIISANTGNGTGISGIASECLLLNVKVTNDNGRCDAATLAEGITWAADHGADIINISITISEGYSRLEEAVDYAWDKGCLIIAAAANETINPVYPACYSECIPVLAADKTGAIMPLTYKNDWVQLSAPGFEIYSTLPGDRYGYWGGTSFAAAHVSGIAALLYGFAEDKNGNGMVNDEVRSAIENGAAERQDGFKSIDCENSINLLNSN